MRATRYSIWLGLVQNIYSAFQNRMWAEYPYALNQKYINKVLRWINWGLVKTRALGGATSRNVEGSIPDIWLT